MMKKKQLDKIWSVVLDKSQKLVENIAVIQ